MAIQKQFNLSQQQQDAADQVEQWFKNKKSHKENPIFRLFGYAGTGKTTITKSIVDQLGLKMGEEVLFAAFMGKAAMVMRRNQLPASTIHALIYQVVVPDEKEVQALRDQMNNGYLNDSERGRLRQELREASRPRFQLRTKSGSGLKNAKLLVLDECSMVNEEMLKDLLTFDVPLLVMGDPGQLPPIEGKSPLTDVKPDVMLTEVHRQAKDNPILHIATCVRQGDRMPQGQLGSSRVIRKYDLTRKAMLSFDQILVGKNATRREINTKMRNIQGFEGTYPQVGEKLICLRNSPDNGLFNGMICYVEDVGSHDKISFLLTIRKETDDPNTPPITVRALQAHFDMYRDENAMDHIKLGDRLAVDEFDFGYAITVHKSQGSQWDNVCLVDDGMFDGWGKPGDRARFLYTGVTRAAESITVAN